jgi:twitching motility two-component system response regulator PilH
MRHFVASNLQKPVAPFQKQVMIITIITPKFMRGQQKILIVEDHKDSCRWIAQVLQQTGYRTMEANDGTIGVQMARKELPDAILLDIHLPAGSGYFVLESLKKVEETRGIPVIIMTGDVDLDAEELEHRGAAAMFKKPMDVHFFVKTIRTVIDNYRSTRMALPA